MSPLISTAAKGGSFNGGTVTAPIVIADPTVGDLPLEIDAPAGAAANGDTLLSLVSDIAATGVFFDAAGGIGALAATPQGGGYVLKLDGVIGLQMVAAGTNLTGFGANGLVLTGNNGDTSAIQLGPGGDLGFFGTAPIAKPHVPAGATTADVVTALTNLGLITSP